MSHQSALVTGASRGIGLGIARMLARRGYHLTISARDEVRLQLVAAELADLGAPRVVVVAHDLADDEAAAAVVGAHVQAYASMSVLVLNAGTGTAGSIGQLPLDRFDKTVRVNLRAPFAMLQASLPALRAAAAADPEHGSRVIALASIAGVHAEPGLAAYSATKAALLSLVDAVNREESARGVLATALAPGFVDTDMAAWVRDKIPPEQMIPVDDIVALVETLIALSRRSVIDQVVIGRAGAPGQTA